MKHFLITLIITCNVILSFGQEFPRWKDGNGFNTVFKYLKTGEFEGAVNGLLIVKNTNNNETLLDFQGGKAKLFIEMDSSEVYDVSTKVYTGFTTSGKTEIRYETYSAANSMGINISGVWYEFSLIDGACMAVINGLDYTYKTEESIEYLILQFTHEITLSNWQYLIRTEHKMNPDNIEQLKPKEKKILIMPNSVIVFCIKRQNKNAL